MLEVSPSASEVRATQLSFFAATIRNGKVATLWWAAPFEAALGRNRIPGDQFISGDQFIPGDQFLQGDQFIPGDQFTSSGSFSPTECGTRACSIVGPGESQLAPELQKIVETGTVGSTRVDWKRQAVLYLTFVPADPRVAAESRSKGSTFFMGSPVGGD